MQLTPLTFLIVCPMLFLAGLVDAIGGGGGLISLPAYLLAGLPVHSAIATNKLSSACGTALATGRFIRKGLVNFRLAVPSVIAAVLGSSLGAKLSLAVSEAAMKYILLAILPAAAFAVLNRHLFRDEGKHMAEADRKTLAVCLVFAFIIGMYDGFYGICTNLMPVTEKNPDGTTVAEILRINHMRWQIEDCFRDMKSEFKSRPVYLSRENRIKAHFLLCCLSLILLKYLEKALRDAKYTDFTTEMLLNQLKEVSMVHLKGHGYVPAFNPSPLLSALQAVFQIPINKEIITEKSMKKITSVSSQG